MMWKIMILFLCAMMLVGMVGKVLFPGAGRRRVPGPGRGAKPALSRFCPDCGRPQIGKTPCGCGKRRA